MKIAFLITENSELMETLDPYDILTREEGLKPELISVRDTKELTMAPTGTKIIVDKLYTEINIENYDVLVLPGGPGYKEMTKFKDMDKILDHFFSNDKVVAAICGGPTILASRGYLKGKEAICFPTLQKDLIGAKIIDKPVITDGNIITARNSFAGIHFGIEIIRKLKGDKRANELEKFIK